MSDAEPRFAQVHVESTGDDADTVAAALFELGATGVEQRDDMTFLKGPGDGRVLSIASFDDEDGAQAAILALTDALPDVSATFRELVGDAWRDEWKKHYVPFALTASVTVCPPWEAPPADAKHVLVLEPGRAFGTGLHSTTSLVAEVLEHASSALAGTTVLDAGCGSGILALLALELGAAHVDAFDIDPDVIGVVEENAARNQMTDRVRCFAGTIADVTDTYPWVLANIEAKVLGPIAEDLARTVAPGGNLVLSGILLGEEAAMIERFTHLSRRLVLEDVRRRETGGERAHDKDGWVALHLIAP